MKNFVISLKSATERRDHINNEFGKHNVSYEFFDALTPDVAKPYAERLDLSLTSTNLTPGELACMMSHVAIWEKIIRENLAYATIFEDDIYLGADAEGLLNSTDWIQSHWNIIKIECFAKKAMVCTTKYNILDNGRYITELKGRNLGAAGYILSLKGAKLFLNYILTCGPQPIDEIIFDIFVNDKIEPIYQMIPALCVQEMILKEHQDCLSLPSSLDRERKIRMKLENKKGLSKIGKEINRIILQTKKTLFAKDIPFK